MLIKDPTLRGANFYRFLIEHENIFSLLLSLLWVLKLNSSCLAALRFISFKKAKKKKKKKKNKNEWKSNCFSLVFLARNRFSCRILVRWTKNTPFSLFNSQRYTLFFFVNFFSIEDSSVTGVERESGDWYYFLSLSSSIFPNHLLQ